ncbi:MAG: urate hydroxylase PuuD [SAR86 cluster bacterium]|nr:urate hydroxylase PuuD [SAR86 cluster bacterium]
MEDLLNMMFRWWHILFGITWIGLLYYFNFIQTEYFKEAEESARKDAVSKLAPRALWWFRWAAFLTFLTGLVLLHFVTMRITTDIILGVVMGTFMMLNVWGIIWPNQKIVIGLKEGDASTAGPKAALASRTNTLFSVAMLYFMVSSAHYPHGGYLFGGTMSASGLYLGLAIILAIEANAIWGKMIPVITSVRAVIVSSFILALGLSSIAYYL